MNPRNIEGVKRELRVKPESRTKRESSYVVGILEQSSLSIILP